MKIGTMIKMLLVVGVLVAGYYYFVDSLKPLATVAVAKTGVAPNSVPGTVLVRAEREMEIRSDLAGRVVESHLDLGKEVKEGDLLIALDLGDLELRIEKVQIEIRAAELVKKGGSRRQFDLIEAQKRLEDVKRNLEIGGASRVDVESAERAVSGVEQSIEIELNAMDVRLEQLQNELKGMERQIEKMSLRSPIDGVITELYAHRGDLVGAGNMVAKIISLDRVVEVQVSEENFSGVEVGQVARVKFLGYGDNTFSGTVSKTLPIADSTTQRYTIHLEMDIEREKLFPGLTGESTITLDERQGAVIIPTSATIGDRVFAVKDGVVSIKRIEKGYGSMTSIEVRSGLEAGDLVIVDQLELFKDGDSVRTKEKEF